MKEIDSHELNDKRMGYTATHELDIVQKTGLLAAGPADLFSRPHDKGISCQPAIPVLAGTLNPFTHPLWLNLSKKRCNLF